MHALMGDFTFQPQQLRHLPHFRFCPRVLPLCSFISVFHLLESQLTPGRPEGWEYMASLPPGWDFPERANCQGGSRRAQLSHLEILKAALCSHKLPRWAGAEPGKLKATFPLRLPQYHLKASHGDAVFRAMLDAFPQSYSSGLGLNSVRSTNKHKIIPKGKSLWISGDLILSLPSSPVGHIRQEVVRSPTLQAAVPGLRF